MSSDYLTAPEIARILRVDVAKVRSWITSGKLQAIDVSAQGRGRPRWRIARSELESFLASRQASTLDRVYRRRARSAAPIDVTQYF